MYGARELRLDPYFSDESNGVIGLILDNNTTTENYDFFRITLIPRLNSTFGKTLRRLKKFKQFTNIDALIDPFFRIHRTCLQNILWW
jgi:hypothetical protein